MQNKCVGITENSYGSLCIRSNTCIKGSRSRWSRALLLHELLGKSITVAPIWKVRKISQEYMSRWYIVYHK